jgi:hypothetical protein
LREKYRAWQATTSDSAVATPSASYAAIEPVRFDAGLSRTLGEICGGVAAMATYSISDLSRREILRMSVTLGVANMASTRFAIAQTAEQRTPEQILGPFYPLKTLGRNADLTKVPGRPGRAKGLILNVMGECSISRESLFATRRLKFGKPTTSPKQLELLSMVVPDMTRVGLLGNPNTPTYASVRKNVEAAAVKRGLSITVVEARSAEEIEKAFPTLAGAGVQAVIVVSDALTFVERDRVAALALQNRLPSMFSLRDYATAGGLMSYGESLSDFYYRAASFVDKIFKGAWPGDLPIEQPTRFHLVINGKTADSLGLAIPSQINVFADEVID